jgi:hypothetical protein
MLGMLDDVIAVARQQGKRGKDLVLDLTGSPTVLDQTGVPSEENPGEYRFTLRQCRKMRRTIVKAARADARRMR